MAEISILEAVQTNFQNWIFLTQLPKFWVLENSSFENWFKIQSGDKCRMARG